MVYRLEDELFRVSANQYNEDEGGVAAEDAGEEEPGEEEEKAEDDADEAELGE